MTNRSEPGWTDPPPERVSFDLGRVAGVGLRDLLVRFAFGAGTSVIAGLLTLAWGPRVGGTMLAFPAILAASLTLIDDEDSAAEAREDGRGALAGALALAAFAALAALLLGSISPVAAVFLASAAWLAVAFGVYAIAWGRRRR